MGTGRHREWGCVEAAAHQFGTILGALEMLLSICRLLLCLKVRLDRLVLLVKVRHVGHKVLDNVPVWQIADECWLGVVLDTDINRIQARLKRSHSACVSRLVSAR